MRVRLGQCVYDTGARQLSGPDGRVCLSPKAHDLLALLIERRPDAVSKAELHDKLWPASFVGPTSLPRLVAEIRRAVGEDSYAARFLRTLPRFGYAFGSAELEPAGPPEAAAPCALRWGPREIPLAQGETLSGRDQAAAVRIPSSRVSRRHARILLSGARAVLEDLGSKNGTFVGGRPVSGATPLKDGDEITIGGATLTFSSADQSDITRSGSRGRADEPC